MSKKAVSITNRQDGVPTQDEPFNDNPDFKWHDFYNMDMPPPGYLSSKIQAPLKLKVNIDTPDQLYYYLGDPSTDAKCFYTDKPGSNEIVAKANFIERVQGQARPVYQYQHQASRQPIAPAAPVRRQPVQNAFDSASIPEPKPYVYKPKDPMRPNAVMWGIDHQALANQRNFLADSSGSRRNSQQFGIPGPQEPQYNYPSSDAARSGTPLRAFPPDQYYSMKTLPAAYPGEHSGFREAARRLSQGSQTMQMPGSQHGGYVPNYQSVKQQQAQLKQTQPGAPMVPMMASSMSGNLGSVSAPSLPPNPYTSHGSRPSSAYSHHSPYGAPLTPATTQSATSASKSAQSPPADEAYLANLKKYPYLLQSFCRKPKVYESPYPIGGGFSMAYQPLGPRKQDDDQKPSSAHTPHGSVSSVGDAGRRTSQQWTPPSQVWDRGGFSNQQQTPPPRQYAPQPPPQPRQYPQATYSTPQEFQRQIQAMPSTASRDGAQARMLRDQGYMPYYQHHRNSFGQSYDTAKMWNSPKAPTPSPLSDPNTPGQTSWGAPMPRAEVAPMGMGRAGVGGSGSGGGYGPTLPQMQGGHETWRYN